MNTKRLIFTGAVTAAVSKFYSGSGWKTALTLGAIAAVAAAVADNVVE